jgi:hypothetical protein
MTDKPRTSSPTASARKAPARPPLYRTVLSIAVAALVAASLPFSVLYINALSKHAQAVANVKAAAQTASPTRTEPASQPTPVTTRTS